MPPAPSLPQLLTKARESAGLTRRELGSLVGLSRDGVEKAERGARDLSVTQLRRWAWFCDVLPGSLLDELPPPPATTRVMEPTRKRPKEQRVVVSYDEYLADRKAWDAQASATCRVIVAYENGSIFTEVGGRARPR